jgi:hypothetical protein
LVVTTSPTPQLPLNFKTVQCANPGPWMHQASFSTTRRFGIRKVL